MDSFMGVITYFKNCIWNLEVYLSLATNKHTENSLNLRCSRFWVFLIYSIIVRYWNRKEIQNLNQVFANVQRTNTTLLKSTCPNYIGYNNFGAEYYQLTWEPWAVPTKISMLMSGSLIQMSVYALNPNCVKGTCGVSLIDSQEVKQRFIDVILRMYGIEEMKWGRKEVLWQKWIPLDGRGMGQSAKDSKNSYVFIILRSWFLVRY